MSEEKATRKNLTVSQDPEMGSTRGSSIGHDPELDNNINKPADADGWDQSANNPVNWHNKNKWWTVAIISFQAFLSPLASSLMAPSLPEISVHYGITSPTVTALTLTIYLLAWALGPLVLAPLSEIWGRQWVINISAVVFLAFNIGCIFAPSTASFIVFRFLAGIGASSPISISGAVIADVFSPAERAPATGAYGMGLLLGPPLGPLIGGYIGQIIGFKYGFVLISALAGVALALSVFGLRETYHPVLRARISRSEKTAESVTGEKWSRRLIDAGKRPIILATTNPICFFLGLYSALVYGYLNMFFTTFPTIFGEHYGFDAGSVGLTYIAGGLGELTATAVGTIFGNKMYHKLTKKNNDTALPEYRLPGLIAASFVIPIALFWFGWTAERTHWIVPVLASALFGFGLMLALLPIQLYIVDTFSQYAASALAATALMRSILGFAIPLFAPQMINAMGLGGTYSLLGGLSIVVGIPAPLYFFYRGAQMRQQMKTIR